MPLKLNPKISRSVSALTSLNQPLTFACSLAGATQLYYTFKKRILSRKLGAKTIAGFVAYS
jgi:hypothetical protein